MYTFDHVVKRIREGHEGAFVGFVAFPNSLHMGMFTVSGSEPEDGPDYVSIAYDGGYMFSSSGEEEFYSNEEFPEIVKGLKFVDESEHPNLRGTCSEYMAYKLLPGLKDPEQVFGATQRAGFRCEAYALAGQSDLFTFVESADWYQNMTAC